GLFYSSSSSCYRGFHRHCAASAPPLPPQKIAKRETQPQQPPLNQQSVIRFLTPGIWYVSLINDQPEPMVADISAELTLRDFQLPNCLNQCSNRGQCTDGRCSCLVGFKGPDCSIPDEVEICSGNGYFDRGRCHCHAQWKGAECEVAWSECLDPLCSGNGRCEAGSCRCFEGFSGDRCQNSAAHRTATAVESAVPTTATAAASPAGAGADCQTPAASANEANERCPADSDTAVRLCSGRGRIVDGRCECDRGFSGDSCEFETCLVTCQHGDCVNGSCQCHLGWSGVRCQLRSCGGTSSDSCSGHGVCVNGTCACDKGWNGPALLTRNNGNCELDPSTGDWRCVLRRPESLARGTPASTRLSSSAQTRRIMTTTGLVDCNDPDCCNQPVCSRAESCSPGAYPQQVLLSEPSLPYVSSFERRVRFLIGQGERAALLSMYFEPR
uniref:EGF-like domain-containing protein n=1 Tax=Macrostomum lignano TaxID=282301 RepID=A0A1I8H760_9PLAT